MDMIEVSMWIFVHIKIHCKFGCFFNMYIIDPLMSVRSYLLFDHDSGGSLWKIENTQIQIILTSCKRRSNKTHHTMITTVPLIFRSSLSTKYLNFPSSLRSNIFRWKKKTWCFITYKHVFAIREKATKIKHTSWHNVGTNELDPLFLFGGVVHAPCFWLKSPRCHLELVRVSGCLVEVGRNLIMLEGFAQCVFQPLFDFKNEAKQWNVIV